MKGKLPYRITRINRIGGVFVGKDSMFSKSNLLVFFGFVSEFSWMFVLFLWALDFSTHHSFYLSVARLLAMAGLFPVLDNAFGVSPKLIAKQIKKKKEKNPDADVQEYENLLKSTKTEKSFEGVPIAITGVLHVLFIFEPYIAIAVTFAILFCQKEIEKYMLSFYYKMNKIQQKGKSHLAVRQVWSEFGSWVMEQNLNLQHPEEIGALYAKYLLSKENPTEVPVSE